MCVWVWVGWQLERALCKHREKNNLADQINHDLTYAVLFNLANAYAGSKMFTESLSTYSMVVKNKLFPQAGRLRVNMVNSAHHQKGGQSTWTMRTPGIG